MATYFKVHAFSPDGEFTAEELKEYLDRGMFEINKEKGIGFRMLPFTVEEMKEEQ